MKSRANKMKTTNRKMPQVRGNQENKTTVQFSGRRRGEDQSLLLGTPVPLWLLFLISRRSPWELLFSKAALSTRVRHVLNSQWWNQKNRYRKGSVWGVLFCFLFIYLIYFIFGCIGSSLLSAGFLSSCSERGLLFVVVPGLLIAVASLVVEHGL